MNITITIETDKQHRLTVLTTELFNQINGIFTSHQDPDVKLSLVADNGKVVIGSNTDV